MKRYATLKDVAGLAGTTAATVSYVLNEKEGRYISDETRKKVLEAAEKLDYIKCNGASSLKGKERKLIAILVPQFANQFFTRIIVASEEVFVNQGYDLVICNTFDNPRREKEILRRMLQQRVDGIVLTPTSEGLENTATVRRLGVKMVVVDRPLEGGDDYCWVTTDNYGCGFKGASYLFEKGHRNIAYIGWESDIPDLNKRGQAVLDAAKKMRIPRKNIVVKNGGFSFEEGYRLTAELLNEHPETSAIFYGFNIQALGGIKCLHDRKIKIPQRISVALIGSPEWVMAGNNNFTHLDMGEYELGKEAAQLLLGLIQNPGEKKVKRTIRDCTLVEGDSVCVKKFERSRV
ncbi:LacI family transcriptional regulator [Treponema sp. OttesenSCG-928-L16]|nr:LacI family transcriptional regulator [Treponema sp. OttesenSCG-928-L16]